MFEPTILTLQLLYILIFLLILHYNLLQQVFELTKLQLELTSHGHCYPLLHLPHLLLHRLQLLPH